MQIELQKLYYVIHFDHVWKRRIEFASPSVVQQAEHRELRPT